MSRKVTISISLGDDGQMGFNASSKNLITVMGMLELAKKIVMDSQKTNIVDTPMVVQRGSNGTV